MQLKKIFKTGLLVGIGLLILQIHNTQAQNQLDYPSPIDPYINDFSDLISEGTESILSEQLSEFQATQGIQITLVTLDSIYDFNTGDEDIETFARNLFNQWGVGDAEKNNGILFLVTPKDREARIQLGAAYGAPYESQMQNIMDGTIVPYFANNEYEVGITNGLNAIMDTSIETISWTDWVVYYKWYLIIGAVIGLLVAAGISALISGKKGWGYVLLAAAFGLLLAMISASSNSNSSSKRGGGFGGGKSSGRGATGKW